MKIKKGDITKTSGIFKPKAIIFMADEMNELMSADDYSAVNKVKDSFNAIGRLGRAAGCHLVLACQRPSSNTIGAELKNNIQLSSLLGLFDSGASSLIFDTDISHKSKPEIKGRGFTKSGNDIIEYQSYYSEPEKDWVFDESLRETFENPIYLEQCKNKGIIDPKWQKPSWFVEEKEDNTEKEEIKNKETENPYKKEYKKDELDDDDIMAMFANKAPKPKQLDENTVETESIKNSKKDYSDDEIEAMFRITNDDKSEQQEQKVKEEIKETIKINPFEDFRKEVNNNIQEEKPPEEEQKFNKFKINLNKEEPKTVNRFRINKKEE